MDCSETFGGNAMEIFMTAVGCLTARPVGNHDWCRTKVLADATSSSDIDKNFDQRINWESRRHRLWSNANDNFWCIDHGWWTLAGKLKVGRRCTWCEFLSEFGDGDVRARHFRTNSIELKCQVTIWRSTKIAFLAQFALRLRPNKLTAVEEAKILC